METRQNEVINNENVLNKKLKTKLEQCVSFSRINFENNSNEIS